MEVDVHNGAELWRRLKHQGFPDAFGWSASGRHVAEEPTKSTPAR